MALPQTSSAADVLQQRFAVSLYGACFWQNAIDGSDAINVSCGKKTDGENVLGERANMHDCSRLVRSQAHLPVVEHDKDVVCADAQDDKDAEKVQHANPAHTKHDGVQRKCDRQRHQHCEHDE